MNLKKYLNYRVRLGKLLVLASIILYLINFFFFKQIFNTEYYLSIDIAFLPIEVLFVVLVIESVINSREKQILLEKLNMVIGTFFSEIGTDLLKEISKFDKNKEKIRQTLILNNQWSQKDFLNAALKIKSYKYDLYICSDAESVEFLKDLKAFFVDKRNFLLVLLENPNLLEHETFTEMLRAVFHLAEELDKRNDISKLPITDYQHLKMDTERAYGYLIVEWLQYMEHLRNNYPYLFSLALRVNPFDPNAKVEVDNEFEKKFS